MSIFPRIGKPPVRFTLASAGFGDFIPFVCKVEQGPDGERVYEDVIVRVDVERNITSPEIQIKVIDEQRTFLTWCAPLSGTKRDVNRGERYDFHISRRLLLRDLSNEGRDSSIVLMPGTDKAAKADVGGRFQVRVRVICDGQAHTGQFRVDYRRAFPRPTSVLHPVDDSVQVEGRQSEKEPGWVLPPAQRLERAYGQ